MRSKVESSKRYIITSVTTNALAYSIFSLIQFNFQPSHPVLAVLFAGFMVLPISFLLNRFWVFQSKNIFSYDLVRFMSIYLLGLFAGSLLLHYLLFILPNVYAAQFTSMIILGLTALSVHTFWTFIQKVEN